MTAADPAGGSIDGSIDGPVGAPDERVVVTTSTCVIALRSDGLQIQQIVEAPPVFLNLARLELLARLDATPVVDVDPTVREVAEDHGIGFRKLKTFANDLRYGNWMGPVDPVRHGSVPDHPSFGAEEPFDLDTSDRVSVELPLVLRLRQGAYELIDHDGFRRAAFTAADVKAISLFVRPIPPRKALQKMTDQPGAEGFDRRRLAEVLGVLDAAGLLRRRAGSGGAPAPEPIDRDAVIAEIFDRHAEAQTRAEASRRARTGVTRPKVVPVSFDLSVPLALGMIVAYAKVHEDGRLDEHYDFRTDWVWSDDRIDELTAEPAVYLFSDYLWSHERCLAVSEAVKERSPGSITIHGGPDCPKYEADCEAYFRDHPHVDITVRGEGEVSAAATLAALVAVVGAGQDPGAQPDLSVLAGVEGISYRAPDGTVVRNPDRPRVADLSILPSPFLTGIFDVYSGVPDLFVTMESNRGCPYGCTFCDWGSATTSRVRLFDLDRIFAEIDWCSEHKARATSLADANFGMFKRDVEIAEHVAACTTSNGFPRTFGVSYAKNTVKHLQQIIRILADAGIVTNGVLSLQSMDAITLSTIHRANIKTERYDALAGEMRRSKLPLMVELMMGLPGQTVDAFAEDLQQCIDREVPARVNHTTLLVNSPMNEPTYLAENEIAVSVSPGRGQQSIVVSTSSFSEQDRHHMEHQRLWFMLFENWGVFRLLARYVRQETGQREMDFYRELARRTAADPQHWPTLHILITMGTSLMTAPYSWALVMEEMRDYVVAELGLADDDALHAIFRAQRAVLPAHGRTFPEVVSLRHDVVAWQHAIANAKAQGHLTDWPDHVARLSSFGPGEFSVSDPDDVLGHGLGMNRELNAAGVGWELDSPLSRAGIAASQLSDWNLDDVIPLRRAT